MLKKSKPITPGQRHIVRIVCDVYTGSDIVPSVRSIGILRNSGRDKSGSIVVRGRGGGISNLLRTIANGGIEKGYGIVIGIQYDPNRTSYIARRKVRGSYNYKYILAADGLEVGTIVRYGDGFDTVKSDIVEYYISIYRLSWSYNGSVLKILSIPDNMTVFNIESVPGFGGKYLRSAGIYANVLKKIPYAILRTKGGKLIKVSSNCVVTIGVSSGKDHQLTVLGKAGRARNIGYIPKVRGEAINPIDHPHGGRTRGGRVEKTRWGRLAKGVPTRKHNNDKNTFIT